MRRLVGVLSVCAAAACGLSVTGVDPGSGPPDAGPGGPSNDGGAPAAGDGAAVPREAGDLDDTPTTDAGEVFSADAGVEAGMTIACAKRALLLVDKDSETEADLTAALKAEGFTVTSVPDSSRSDGTEVAASSPGVIVVLAGTGSKVDMAPALQTAVQSALASGTGFVTEEWSGYNIDRGRFQTIAPYVLFSYTTWNYLSTVDGKAPTHPIWKGMPASFRPTERNVAVGIGTVRGNGATTIGTTTVQTGGRRRRPSFSTRPVVLAQDNGRTRVAETMLAIGYASDRSISKDANIRRLFTNMATWAAHCDTL